jgi:CRP-like cAMP-binding protein
MEQNLKYPEVYEAINSISPIPVEEWEKAAQFYEQRSAKKGDFLLKPGDNARMYIMIQKGLMRMYHSNSRGQEFTKTFLRDGDIVCAYSELLQNLPSRVHVECMTDASYLYVKDEDLEKFKKGHQCWGELTARLTEKYFIFREQREYELLTMSTLERYEKLRESLPDLFNNISQYQIASYLGVTPVSLSRVLSKRVQ